MPQHQIEMILMRQLASHLRTPILIVDPRGHLVYFNEAAEPILGRRFEETGEIRRGEWSAVFAPTNDDGSAVPREEQPLFIATEHHRPAYRRSWIRGLDGVLRQIEGVAFPLLGVGARFLGAAGIFWEVREGQTKSGSREPAASHTNAPRSGSPRRKRTSM
jgi:PAS domain-containing protein